nr:uncharacterized protein LOC129425860 [Misgurnus anguillicaudatus]
MYEASIVKYRPLTCFSPSTENNAQPATRRTRNEFGQVLSLLKGVECRGLFKKFAPVQYPWNRKGGGAREAFGSARLYPTSSRYTRCLSHEPEEEKENDQAPVQYLPQCIVRSPPRRTALVGRKVSILVRSRDPKGAREKSIRHVEDTKGLGAPPKKNNDKLSCKALSSKSTLIEDGNPARYCLQKSTDNLNQSKSYRKITFGERNTDKPHKIILMVGETGSGKTTLINTMINYICGVQRKDKVWFEITDDQSNTSSAHSQTSDVTVYDVYIQETSVDLTIIDTPGYGDTRGAEHDKEIAESLLCLCTTEDVINEINAVCFVIMAHQNRLSDRQQYIFDAVQSLFGSDIGENIVLLFTHSTGARPKNALKAVKEAKVKCAVDEKKQPIYFLFDNCQEETFDEDEQTIYDHSWDLSYKGIKEFFNFLDTTQPKTLQMTQKVLKERMQLEANISNLQSRVQDMDIKQNELKQTQEALVKHKKDVEENNNFEYEVEVSYKEKVDINPAVAKQAMCCTVCEENCHYPGCWWICDISGCSVMKNNHCLVCTKKCHYSKHTKEAKIYETKTKTETRTYEALKKDYEDKIGDGESLVKKLQEELQELEKVKIKLAIEAYHCVESLKIIALNTLSLFTLQHIDFLIEKLKEINEPGKCKALKDIKERSAGNYVMSMLNG